MLAPSNYGTVFSTLRVVVFVLSYMAKHPDAEELIQKIGGESVDIIADKSEALVGMFELGKEDLSPFIWTRNKWFVVGNRDSLRHDFYHYFLNKTYDCSEPLTAAEKQIYEFIKKDE